MFSHSQGGCTHSVEEEYRRKELQILEHLHHRFLHHRLIVEMQTATIALKGELMGRIAILVNDIMLNDDRGCAIVERTHEIGIRKAIGAQESTIVTQFLSESILISFIGSMAGLVIGVGLSQGVGRFVLGYNVPFSLWPVILSVTVAVVVGLASGVVPALKAAKLNPIDSLRYE